MIRKPLFLAGFVLVVAAMLAGCSRSDSEGAATGQKYHCPMHPTYVSDRPGDCPICNMKLVPIKDDQPAPKSMAPASEEKTAHIAPGQYYCPMDTDVVRDAPGTCPECNMRLIQKQAAAPAAHEETHAQAVPGRVMVSVSPEKRQLIGLRVAETRKREIARTVRAVALVEHDETRFARIAPRFSGWVRQLHVAYTGAPVEQGQPLFTVYSPELFSSESEYLTAWRAAQQMKSNGSPVQQQSAEALLDSARLRLSLFQIGDAEIRALEERGKAASEMLFRAPFSGHVITKNAIEGSAFESGETLFEIADLSHLWLRAYVPESDLPLIQEGQSATIEFPYLRNKTFEAKVTFIYPHVEPETRRAEIRIELDNPGHAIRPNMWANVTLRAESEETLTVPASAVIDTGERYIAFVDRADKHLEPRQVKVGLKTDDYYEVLSGLAEGERVVERALFLIDSESQLKAAIAGMTSDAHAH